MRTKEEAWTAVEDRGGIRQALSAWQKKLFFKANRLRAMGIEIAWDSGKGFWAGFSDLDDPLRTKYWNTFGMIPEDFRRNIIVQVNPPLYGKNLSVKGAVARDPLGRIWILHRGGLTGRPGISLKSFNKIYKKDQIPIRFSDNKFVLYHPITRVDAPSEKVCSETAAFIRACRYVRDYYVEGQDIAEELRNFDETEDMFSEESEAEYVVPAREELTAVRTHATIANALVRELYRLGIKSTNRRVRRFGADVITLNLKQAMLFEIKSYSGLRAIYEGFGQLFIYEKLYEKMYRKVLVLPDDPPPGIREILTEYKVGILIFQAQRRVEFDKNQLARLTMTG